MNVVTAGIFRAPMAANRKNTKTSQNTTRAMPLLALAPGSTRSTYLLASEPCRWRSRFILSSTLRTTPATTLATMKPISSSTKNPSRLGRNAKNASNAFCTLSPKSMILLPSDGSPPTGRAVPAGLRGKPTCLRRKAVGTAGVRPSSGRPEEGGEPMLNQDEIREVIGATAYDRDGEKIGKVGQVFLDDESGAPEFVTVNTGFFGSNESFVPVTDAQLSGDRLSVPYPKDRVKDAPNVDVDNGHLDHDQEAALYAHYGRSGQTAPRSRGTDDVRSTVDGRNGSGGESDAAMTRSEERLEVGTATQEAGRARLRKYVTTEMETHTVPVRK